MKIEILGSGGAAGIPRPGHDDAINKQAREKGIPYARMGPSIFIHDIDLIIDTPEEIKIMLNRAGIGLVAHCLYSHWHPDHTLGYRFFESMNFDLWQYPAQHRTSQVYLPQQVAVDAQVYLGLWGSLQYLQRMKLINVNVLADDDVLQIDNIRIRPFRVAEDYVYAFELTQNATRVVIAPDELFGWQPPKEIGGVDVLICPMGLPKTNPLTGAQIMPDNHPVLRHEATYQQTLEMVAAIDAKRTILTHIEPLPDLGYDELLQLQAQHQKAGRNIEFAYDHMMIEV